jgi:hypothetical protein
LAKLLAESNFKELGINHLQAYEDFPDIDEFYVTIPTIEIQLKFYSSIWYSDIVSYLLTLQCLRDLTPSKARTLKLYVVKYCIVDRKLYWKGTLGFLLRCLIESETVSVINEFHEGMCGGHSVWRETAYKILRVGYYWMKLFTEMNTKVRAVTPVNYSQANKSFPHYL